MGAKYKNAVKFVPRQSQSALHSASGVQIVRFEAEVTVKTALSKTSS